VRITSGIGAGLVASTDADGRYTLLGARGDIELRVVADGFEAHTLSLSVGEDLTRDIALTTPGVPSGVAGAWNVTFSASLSCRSTLPEAARDRQYSATIAQESAELRITFFAASLQDRQSPGTSGFFESTGSVRGNDVSFVIAGDTSYNTFSSTNFVDYVNGTDYVGISAFATGVVINYEIHLTMAGDYQYFRATGVDVCRANDHRVVFRRR